MASKWLSGVRASVLFTLVTAGVWCQTAETVEFEVVSIKPMAPGEGRGFYGCRGGPGSSDPGQITCRHETAQGLIPSAFGIDFARVSYARSGGGSQPEFAIDAKVPHGATKEQVQQMWQKLLHDRFQLAAHRETKEMPVYELVVAKGGFKGTAWVAPANPVEPPEIGTPRKRDPDGFPIVAPGEIVNFFTGGKAWLAASGVTIDDLARMLEGRLAINERSPKPVIDASGLKGKYDLKFWWSPVADSPRADSNDQPEGPSMLSALESQLGLKVQARKSAPVEILVVDHLEATPTEN